MTPQSIPVSGDIFAAEHFEQKWERPMDTTRKLIALTLCVLAVASLTLATAPAAAQTDAGTGDASNATELDASFEDDEAGGCWSDSGVNPPTLTANRDTYHVTVTANDLDSDTLVTIFDDELDTADPAIANLTRVDGGVRMRVLARNVTITANISDEYVDTGDYAFEFVTDGNATAESVVTRTESECVNAVVMRGGSVQTARSGVATIPIRLEEIDEARVRITNDDVSLAARIEDGNDDRFVTLSLNTHLVGRNAPDGHGRTYWTREGLTVPEPADSITDIALEDAPGGNDPLPAGEYDIEVRHNEHTLDTGSLSITGTDVADFESWMGPADTLSNATAGDIRRAIANETLVDNESVSNDSALVYEIESASLFGPLEAAVSQYEGTDQYAQALFDVAADRELLTVPANPVTFDVTADSGTRIDLRETSRNDGLVVAADHDNDTLYLGLRTDRLAVANGTAVGSGAEFDASLTVDGDRSQEPVTFRDVNATLLLPSTPQTPAVSTPDDPGTEQDEPADTTVRTTSESTAAPTTAPPADDPTEQSPDATTTADGPGFGVAGVVLAVLALAALAMGRIGESG